MALSAHAAAAGLSCKPFGKADTLIGHNEGNSHKQFQYGYNDKHKFHGFLQVKNSTADQKFQFYECEAPGAKFDASHGSVHFGQIRPVEKDNLCLSNSGVFIYKDGVKKDDNIRLEPQGIENTLLLKPCASKGDDLRHQWFSARNVDGCGLRVALKGQKDDIESDGLVHNGDWSVSFNPFDSWPWREATYLASDVDPKCPMQRN
ncbi:hypothetical protein MNAN1_001079 [Malassezia nana]|uniref:Uncharacterized protein n=1 Tax=Malassezia nana TaxID=180528 RepID=A0AAF0EI98_9BASI|nr:hypothetical protein MNAN1_001079 [Malassezia nana]